MEVEVVKALDHFLEGCEFEYPGPPGCHCWTLEQGF